MKTTAIAALLVLLAGFGYAQTDTTQNDTTRIKIGDMKVIMIDESPDDSTSSFEFEDDECENSKLELTHWGGIDLGVNFFLNADGGTDFTGEDKWLELDPVTSLAWSFNLFEQKVRIVHDYVGLIVGGGFEYHSYGFQNNVDLVSDADTTYGVMIPDSVVSLTKNKLRTAYITTPLILEFNTSDDNSKSFHIGVGVVGGLRLGTITKVKYEINGEKHKDRVSDDFNISDWKLDLTARIGFGPVTIFGTYGLTPFFEDNQGPDITSMTLGVSLIPW
jgi:hypothetical protein